MRKIPITDHRLFEVRLIVAVPDYGTGTFDALDAIVPFIDEEVTVLDMSSKALVVAVDEPNHPATSTFTITNNTSTTTVPVVAAQPRKKSKAINSHKRWTNKDRAEVLKLADKGIAHKEIAKMVGRTVSSVDNQIWLMRKGA